MSNGQPLGRGLGSLIPQKSSSPVAPRRDVAPPVTPAAPASTPAAAHVPPVGITRLPPAARLEEGAVAVSKQRMFDIPVGLIDPNPHQPRRQVVDEAFDDLVASIKQHGILQPLIVTKHGARYQLIAGERRFRAAQRLGLPSVPAVVRDSHELEQLEWAIVENVQRQDLNPVEEALAYRQLVDEFGLTQDEVAKKVGKSRTTVANALRVLTLPPEMLAALRDGRLTTSHAKVLLTAVTPAERDSLFRQILQQKLPVRAAATLGQQTTVHRYSRRRADPLLQATEDELRNRFGTKVTITKRDQRGRIAIDFYSDEEYQALVERLRH